MKPENRIKKAARSMGVTEAEAKEAMASVVGKCGKQLFGFMPACVLDFGHDGPCQDGFGGFYCDNRPKGE